MIFFIIIFIFNGANANTMLPLQKIIQKSIINVKIIDKCEFSKINKPDFGSDNAVSDSFESEDSDNNFLNNNHENPKKYYDQNILNDKLNPDLYSTNSIEEKIEKNMDLIFIKISDVNRNTIFFNYLSMNNQLSVKNKKAFDSENFLLFVKSEDFGNSQTLHFEYFNSDTLKIILTRYKEKNLNPITVGFGENKFTIKNCRKNDFFPDVYNLNEKEHTLDAKKNCLVPEFEKEKYEEKIFLFFENDDINIEEEKNAVFKKLKTFFEFPFLYRNENESTLLFIGKFDRPDNFLNKITENENSNLDFEINKKNISFMAYFNVYNGCDIIFMIQNIVWFIHFQLTDDITKKIKNLNEYSYTYDNIENFFDNKFRNKNNMCFWCDNQLNNNYKKKTNCIFESFFKMFGSCFDIFADNKEYNFKKTLQCAESFNYEAKNLKNYLFDNELNLIKKNLIEFYYDSESKRYCFNQLLSIKKYNFNFSDENNK